MKRNIIISAALALAVGSALAAGNNNGPVFGNVTNNSTTNNQGGQGGQGGAGGSASAIAAAAASSVATGGNAVATGGSVSNRNDISTDVRNTNLNSANQHQGQTQGQQQAAISGGNSFSSNVAITESQRPVSSAIAAPLAASNGTCMGSTSAGAQGVTIGLSVGTTWTDAECNRRYNSIRMQELGEKAAAVALMCQDSDVAAAMEVAGTPCPGAKKKADAGQPAQVTAAAQYEHTDPIIRARLGLAPLAK